MGRGGRGTKGAQTHENHHGGERRTKGTRRGGGGGREVAHRLAVPRVGKKLGDSHSFGLNDWILFDDAAPWTVQSPASTANAGHAHLPPRRCTLRHHLRALSRSHPVSRVSPGSPLSTLYPDATPRLLSFGG